MTQYSCRNYFGTKLFGIPKGPYDGNMIKFHLFDFSISRSPPRNRREIFG
jgi:hypothetical protein